VEMFYGEGVCGSVLAGDWRQHLAGQ
jgi:hypothetical protein